MKFLKICLLLISHCSATIVDDYYDDAYYIDDVQNDYTQGESTNKPLIGNKFSSMGKNLFRKIELNTFGEAMEEMLEDDEQLWNTLFQHHFN